MLGLCQWCHSGATCSTGSTRAGTSTSAKLNGAFSSEAMSIWKAAPSARRWACFAGGGWSHACSPSSERYMASMSSAGWFDVATRGVVRLGSLWPPFDPREWRFPQPDGGQQVVGVVNHRPSYWDIERSAVPASVIDDNRRSDK